MSIEINSSSDITPGTTEVFIPDFLVWNRGGRTVQLSITADLKEVPPDLHGEVLDLLLQRRLMLTSVQMSRRKAHDVRDVELEKRQAAYLELPWYRKLFARKPTS